MPYDLRHERWIPWRRKSGDIEWGPPAALLRDFHADPVVAVSTSRPDFDGALQEFLIGMLTAALAPADDDAWHALWMQPPTEEALQRAFDALPAAFTLDGDGPRFLQDLAAMEFVETEPVSIDQLLIDTPGGQTARHNTDLFVKRNRARQVGRPAAAMALITLQTYAPAGGRGNRTSMRGGGPLTTLIDPRVDDTGNTREHALPLWLKLWANAETASDISLRTPAGAPSCAMSTYPWLTSTRISTAGSAATSPRDANPLQAYFGCPRRIRLEFGDAGTCQLTGMHDEETVTGFRMRNYGVQYVGWKHPLSPHYRTRLQEGWLAVHPQPSGLGWRDWAGLALRAPEGAQREPAAAVERFNRRAQRIGARAVRLHAFGYDMDNMKARAWLDASLPLFVVDDDGRALLHQTSARLVDATGIVAVALMAAVKAALFQNPDEARGDFSAARQDLWADTEPEFHAIIRSLASSDVNRQRAMSRAAEHCTSFRSSLEHHALRLFDERCPPAGLTTQPLRRRVAARAHLLATLRGQTRPGERLFELLGIAEARQHWSASSAAASANAEVRS